MGEAPRTVASETGATGAGWTIQVRRDGGTSTVTVACGPGETVLAALRRSVARPKLGCRRGGCGICKVTLLAGSVSYERVVAESVLTPAERTEGVCLTCRAIPESDLVVELREEEGRKGDVLLRLYQDVVERSRRQQPGDEQAQRAAG